MKKKSYDLNIDISELKSHSNYRKMWEDLSRIEIKCVESNPDCKHKIGDTHYYKNPYKRPDGVCEALLHVLDLYLWRVTFGFPSWNAEDRHVYKIHCPDHPGTVWEMRKAPESSE